MISHVKKIAVLRANALGDFIFSLPALWALRQTYPHAQITLLATPWHKEFLSKRPSPIDRVIVIPPSKGIRDELPYATENEMKLFFTEMKKEDYDIAIQLHGGGKNSNPFLLRLGAKITIGLKTPDAPLLTKWIPYVYYQNEYLRYLEVVSLIGATTSSLQPFIQTSQKDGEEVKEKLPTLQHPYFVIHPGASDLRRRWSPENFAIIADFLAGKGYEIVITGTINETAITKEVIRNMDSPAINATNILTLSGLTGLLSNATGVISNDTGPLHLAYALNKPTVGIYWCGNMINGAPLSRGFQRTAISWTTHCPVCKTDCSSEFKRSEPDTECTHETSFVSDISTVEVKYLIQQLLSERKFQNKSQTHAV